jgi:hypothetical protein
MTLRTGIEQAGAADPREQRYVIDPQTNEFADGGRRWRRNSDLCLRHLEKSAEALKGLDALSREERSDYQVPDEVIAEMKLILQTTYERVSRERNLRRGP